MAINFRRIYQGTTIMPVSADTTSELGDLQVLTSTNRLIFNNGSASAALLTAASSDILTNKSLSDTTTAFVNATTPSKELKLDLSGSTASTILTLATNQSTTQSLAIPNVGSGDSILTANATQTLTNKTIDASLNTISNIPAGSLTGILPIANGGTGSATTSQNFVFAGPTSGSGAPSFRSIVSGDIPTLNQNTTGTASNVTGIVAVANGGTGLATLTANAVIVGNGSSNPTFIAPGSTGNVLTSNGTTWSSQASAGGGGVTALQNYVANAFQPYVDQSAIMAATATTGSPAAGTFYSSIVNRSSMLDLSKDLKARIGLEQLMFTDLVSMPNEYGTSGESVFSVKGERYNSTRFIGAWTRNNSVLTTQSTYGESIVSSTSGDSFEIVFYGTGISLLIATAALATMNATFSIDGGSSSSNIFANNYRNALSQNGITMQANQEIVLTNNLTLGVHTLKVTLAAAAQVVVYGVRINNNSANITINAGNTFIGGQEYVSSSQQTLAYTSSVTGSKGGRVLVSQGSGGTISNSFTAVNASQTTLGSTVHTNESVASIYYPRCFGLGINTSGNPGAFLDYSNYFSSNAAAYTLNDGTTTLTGFNNNAAFTNTNGYGISIGSSTNGFMTFTFIGCGIDIVKTDNSSGTVDTWAVSLDGSSLGNLSTTGSLKNKLIPIAGGLPFGTHVLQFNCTNNTGFNSTINKFIVYQPSLPALPSNSVALAEYNVFATYSANSSATSNTVATGIMRKQNIREALYNGTGWASSTPQITPFYPSGYEIATSTSGDASTYYFWGTGFEYRFVPSTGGTAPNLTVLIDGLVPSTANFPGSSLTSYGNVSSFTASTGAVVTSTTGTTNHSAFGVSGLALGWHKLNVALTNSPGSAWTPGCLDVITPIYTYGYGVNGDPLGSISINDLRNILPNTSYNLYKPGFMSRYGTQNTWTLSNGQAGPVPVGDLYGYFYSDGNPLKASYSIMAENSGGGQSFFQLYIDNQPYGMAMGTVSTGLTTVTNDIPINLPAGLHFISLSWYATSGTTNTYYETIRSLTITPLSA